MAKEGLLAAVAALVDGAPAPWLERTPGGPQPCQSRAGSTFFIAYWDRPLP